MTVGKGSMDISVIQGAKAVYIAYRQANMTDYISFDEFIDKWILIWLLPAIFIN